VSAFSTLGTPKLEGANEELGRLATANSIIDELRSALIERITLEETNIIIYALLMRPRKKTPT